MKSKLKSDWIPRWLQVWNKTNLPQPKPLYPPLATNHNRHRIRKMQREFERNQGNTDAK